MRRSKKVSAATLSLLMAATAPVLASSSSWTVDGSGTWITDGNWDNAAPGIASGTNSTDIATFGLALTSGSTVTIDANRNIGGIIFDSSTAFGYTLATGALRLSAGAVVQNTAASGAHSDVISSAIQIQGDGGSATFTANGTNTSNSLRVTGNITGVSTAPNFTTLNLNGSSLSSTTSTIPTNSISGTITGRMSVVKSGTGLWLIGGTNNYSGGTTVLGGTLLTSNTTGLGSGTITLGASSGSDNATVGFDQGTLANNILVAAGSTGVLTIAAQQQSGTPQQAIFSGDVTLNNDVTFHFNRASSTGTRSLVMSGVVSGGFTVTAKGESPVNNTSRVYITNSGNGTAFTGDIKIDSATLIFSPDALGNGVAGQGDGKITFISNGALQWAAGNTQDLSTKTIDALPGVTGTLDIATNNITLASANGLTGAGNFTKFAGSAGILTLAAANNLSGTYTADSTGGATLLTHQNALQSATVSILTGVTTGGIAFDSSVGGNFTFGNLTGAGALALTDNAAANVTLTVGGNNTSPAAYTGVLSGGGSIIKVGTGSATFSGANVFTGGLTIKEGTVIAGVANATTVSGAAGPSTSAITLGDSTGSVAATLLSNVTGAISNGVNLGAGTGTKAIGNNGNVAANFSSIVSLNNRELTLQSGGTGSVTMSGQITGTGNVVINNTGTTSSVTIANAQNTGTITTQGTSTGGATLTNIGSNTLGITHGSNGNLTVSGGTVGAGNLTFSGTGAGVVSVASAVSITTTGLILNNGTTSGTTTISAVIGANVASVTQNSATSSMALGSVANAFTGGLFIRQGQVSGGANGSTFGAASNVITLGTDGTTLAATLRTTSSQTYANPIATASNSTGVLTIGGSGGNPTYTGGITLNNSNVQVLFTLGANSSFSGGITGTGDFTINSTINSGVSTTFSGASAINFNGVFTNNVAANSGTVTTSITAPLGTNLTGLVHNSLTSILSLNNANASFDAPTTVAAGTLRVAGGTLGTSNVTVLNSGILELTNATSLANTSTLVVEPGGSLKLTYSSAGLEAVGGLVLGGTSYDFGTVFNSGNNWGGFGNSTGFFAGSTGGLTVVPEPASLSLVALGLTAVLKRRRRAR